MASASSSAASNGVTCPAPSSWISRAGDLPAHGTHLGRRREGVVPAHDQQRGTIDPGQQPRAVWAIGQAPQRSGVANRIAGKNHLPQSIDDLRTSLQRGGRQQARNHGISQKTRAFQLYPPGRFQAPRGHLGRSRRSPRVAENQSGQVRPIDLEEPKGHVTAHGKSAQHDRLADLQGVEHGRQIVGPIRHGHLARRG